MLAVVMAGCLDGNFAPNSGGDGGSGGEAEALARQEFTSSVSSIYAGQCGACHTAGALGAPAFGDSYDSLTAYNNHALVSCDTPAASLFVSKGEHPPGMAFKPQPQLDTVTNWVTGTWAAAVCGGGPVAGEAVTGSFLPQIGPDNSLDLSGLAPGLAGTKITFTAQNVTGGLYLSSMKIVAGAGGVVVKAPLFSSCISGASTSDGGDTFKDLDLTVTAGQTVDLAPGSMSFIGWSPGDAIAVAFQKIEPVAGAQGPYTPGGGACAAPL